MMLSWHYEAQNVQEDIPHTIIQPPALLFIDNPYNKQGLSGNHVTFKVTKVTF